MRHSAMYDFLALIVSFLVGLASSSWLPWTSAVLIGLLAISLWLSLTGALLPREPSPFVQRRAARGAAGVILASASLALLLSNVADIRVCAAVAVAGVGIAGAYAHYLSRP